MNLIEELEKLVQDLEADAALFQRSRNILLKDKAHEAAQYVNGRSVSCRIAAEKIEAILKRIECQELESRETTPKQLNLFDQE